MIQQMHDEAKKLINDGLDNETIIKRLSTEFTIDAVQAQKLLSNSVDDLNRKKAFNYLLIIGIACVVVGAILKLLDFDSYIGFGTTTFDLIIGLIIVGFGFILSALRRYNK